MKDNAKLQIVTLDNEGLKKIVAKLEEEIQEWKRVSFETNERLDKIELKEALKEETMDTMWRDVSDMKKCMHDEIMGQCMWYQTHLLCM